MRHAKNLSNKAMARGHTFSDPNVKEEMLDLRRQGYSYVEIARKYHADHTTILYHCKKAGLILGRDAIQRLFCLVKQGLSAVDVGLRLHIPSTVVDFYCFRYGVVGNGIVFRTKTKLKSIVEPKPNGPVYSKLPKSLNQFTKVDERGVEWIMGVDNQWICMGKTEKQYRLEQVEEKKRILEKRRLEMLTY